MAAMLSGVARRSILSSARSWQQSSSRGCHILIRTEAQAAGAAHRMPSASATEFPSFGASPFRCRRTPLPRIACAQSLLPLYSATATAQLVSRLSTSSLSASAIVQGALIADG